MDVHGEKDTFELSLVDSSKDLNTAKFAAIHEL
jgi:hypothetical protein